MKKYIALLILLVLGFSVSAQTIMVQVTLPSQGIPREDLGDPTDFSNSLQDYLFGEGYIAFATKPVSGDIEDSGFRSRVFAEARDGGATLLCLVQVPSSTTETYRWQLFSLDQGSFIAQGESGNLPGGAAVFAQL